MVRPCRMLSPIVDEIAEEVQTIKVGKLMLTNSRIWRVNLVMSIPTLILFKNGQPVKTNLSAQNRKPLCLTLIK